jgi:glycosyltransferase involved in cell wall biosynthesis
MKNPKYPQQFNITYHHRTRGMGAESVHILGVYDAFKKLGHNVSMLSFPGADPSLSSAQDPGKADIKSRSFNPLKLAANLTRFMPQFLFEACEVAYNLVAFPRLHKCVKKNKTDLVYERYSLFMIAGVLYAKLTGKKIIIEVNDSALVHRVRPLTFKWLARTIEKWVFKNTDGIVFISTYFQKLAIENYGSDIINNSCVSPNAANLDHFKPSPEASLSAKKNLGLESQVVLGYVGAFVHWHGIDWFVDEIASKLKENPHLTLLLVGSGVALDSIKQRVKLEGVEDQVILPGRVPHSDVHKYISAMDFGIIPDSNHYGSPMKLFEFMAMGVGMVVPDFDPITEVVSDNKNSWLFKSQDRQACVNKVLEISKSPALQSEVGVGARQYIVNERQWVHNAQTLLGLVSDNDIAPKQLVVEHVN